MVMHSIGVLFCFHPLAKTTANGPTIQSRVKVSTREGGLASSVLSPELLLVLAAVLTRTEHVC